MIATCYMMVLGFLKFIGTCTIYLRENRKLSIDRQNLLQPGKLAIGKGFKSQNLHETHISFKKYNLIVQGVPKKW